MSQYFSAFEREVVTGSESRGFVKTRTDKLAYTIVVAITSNELHLFFVTTNYC